MKWSKTRVLVTGASGFIGYNLLKKLVALGAEVVALDNFSSGQKQRLEAFDGEIVEQDITDATISKNIRGDLDYIFHFGAPSSVILFNKDPVKCFNDTCGGFLNVINFAKKKGILKLVYPSSGSVYGRIRPPQSENDIPEPLNLYGLAKLTCEEIARFYSNEIHSVGLRIFAGYGPGEDHKGEISSPVTLFLRSILHKERPTVFGDGSQSRDFVYIENVVDAIVRSVSNKKLEENACILNVGSGKSWTFKEVINIINRTLETNIDPVFVPKPINYLENTQADTTLMKNELEVEPISLSEGLSRYLQTINSRDSAAALKI